MESEKKEVQFKMNDEPFYHLSFSEFAFPADPNGMFFAGGYFHLMFIYDKGKEEYAYGHLRSRDLLSFERLPDALAPDDLDGGIYSGGTYLDEDGVCHLSYWALGKNGGRGGIRLAHSVDSSYLKFVKDRVIAIPETDLGVRFLSQHEGYDEYVSVADPSNVFKIKGRYYMELGNLCALNENRDNPLAPERLKGDWTDLYSSEDLKTWSYEHRFYERKADNSLTSIGEDDMCPAFFPLRYEDGLESGKYLQLFISHNRGAQYYIGSLDEDEMVFVIEKHGRFSLADNTTFAPELFVAPDGRLIGTFWFREILNYDDLDSERKRGHTGVYTLFREFYLSKDGDLVVRPLNEYKRLSSLRDSFSMGEKENLGLGVDSHSSRIVIKTSSKAKLRFSLLFDEREKAEMIFDGENFYAAIDTTSSGARGRLAIDKVALLRTDGEHDLDIFVDDSVLEFYFDGQVLARRLFASKPVKNMVVSLEKGAAAVECYDMKPITKRKEYGNTNLI